MPPVEEVFKQFLLLGSKLRTAARDVATAASPGRRWKGASGTVIMKDLWADPELKKLTAGCEAYLYLCGCIAPQRRTMRPSLRRWAASGMRRLATLDTFT